MCILHDFKSVQAFHYRQDLATKMLDSIPIENMITGEWERQQDIEEARQPKPRLRKPSRSLKRCVKLQLPHFHINKTI